MHLKVPSHAEVQDLLRKHDADWNGRLDYAVSGAAAWSQRAVPAGLGWA